MKAPKWWLRFYAKVSPARKLIVVPGDELPATLPTRDLVVARDGSEDWSVGLRCPCGCGAKLEMMLLADVEPRWEIAVDAHGQPTLKPSVWKRDGCRSHFWVRGGRIVWCD